MREILFRGKNIETKDWVYGFFQKSHAGVSFIITPRGGFFEIYSNTLGQFTGLLDKNENKIFEGDILKCINPNDREEYITSFIASMVNGFTFTNTRLTRELALYDNDWPDEIEVIGNIIDNSNLLL